VALSVRWDVCVSVGWRSLGCASLANLPREDLIPNGHPHTGSNILVICVNIMLLFDIINVCHLGGGEFIIFIAVKSWRSKLCVIRIIFEIILVQTLHAPYFQLEIKFHLG
jgi:hypothetical protein